MIVRAWDGGNGEVLVKIDSHSFIEEMQIKIAMLYYLALPYGLGKEATISKTKNIK